MKMTEKKRIYWIDYSRLIGVFLVILGHIPFLNHNIGCYIYSFHMPLFFILSGYLEKGKTVDLKESIKKDARYLLIPYVSFYIIAYVWWLIQKFIHSNDILTFKEVVVRPILGLFLGEWYNTPFSIMINTPLWFLLCLFICKVLFKYSLWVSKNYHWCLFFINILAIVLVFIMHQFNIDLYFSIDSAIMALPFYSFGYFFKFIDINKFSIWLNILLSFVCLIIVGILSDWNGRVDIADFTYGNNILVFYIAGIAGSLGVIYFALLFENKQNALLLYLGQNTLIIFALHGIVNPIVRNFYTVHILKKSGVCPFDFGDGVIVGLIVLILSSVPIFFIHRYCPFILGQYLNKKG